MVGNVFLESMIAVKRDRNNVADAPASAETLRAYVEGNPSLKVIFRASQRHPGQRDGDIGEEEQKQTDA